MTALAIVVVFALFASRQSAEPYASLPEDPSGRSIACGPATENEPYFELASAVLEQNSTGLRVTLNLVNLSRAMGMWVGTAQGVALQDQLPANWQRRSPVSRQPEYFMNTTFWVTLDYGQQLGNRADQLQIQGHLAPGDFQVVYESEYSSKVEYFEHENRVTLTLPPSAMGRFPLGKQANFSVGLVEDFGYNYPMNDPFIYSTLQNCNSDVPLPPTTPTVGNQQGVQPNSGTTASAVALEERVTSLLESHGLPHNLPVGSGSDVVEMDPSGMGASLCFQLRSNNLSFDETASTLRLDQAQQWISDVVTIYCPDNISKLPW
nr:hypothetical protein [Rhodococcus qingshengii]